MSNVTAYARTWHKTGAPVVRHVTTLRLRVPRLDWAAVACGEKTQFRQSTKLAPNYNHVQLPRPVVLYSLRPNRPDSAQHRLMVLLEVKRHPLGAISPEDLALEGFESIREFRKYWRVRNGDHGFKPLASVTAYTIRRFVDGDVELMGARIFEHLYGEYL